MPDDRSQPVKIYDKAADVYERLTYGPDKRKWPAGMGSAEARQHTKELGRGGANKYGGKDSWDDYDNSNTMGGGR